MVKVAVLAAAERAATARGALPLAHGGSLGSSAEATAAVLAPQCSPGALCLSPRHRQKTAVSPPLTIQVVTGLAVTTCTAAWCFNQGLLAGLL